MPRSKCCTYNPGYLRSPPGILKIVEAVVCLLACICAVIHPGFWPPLTLNFVLFVTISAWLAVMLIFFFNICHVVGHPVFVYLVLMFYVAYDIFLLVSGILAAVYASKNYVGNSSVAAAAFFCFFALAAFIIDTVMQFGKRRTGRSSGESTTATTVSS